jgi:hypothetical protein
MTNELPQSALDVKTFAIGVLSLTACVLFVGFILVCMTPRAALAIGQNDRGGDYIILTQKLSSSQEGIVVIDAASQQMTLYAFNYSRKELEIAQQNIPLRKLPGAREEGGARNP